MRTITKHLYGIALSVVVLAPLSNAFADDRPKLDMKCETRFAEMDTDKNGQLTLEEFTAGKHPGGQSADVFNSKDANGDGVITPEEFCAAKGMGTGKGK